MRSWRLILLPWLILVATLGTTWLSWNHEQQAADKELRSRFDFALRDAGSRIEQRMAAYEQMLRGVQGLIAATGTINRQVFRNYVDALRLDANFSGVQTIGIAELVTAARKESHIAAMRQAGFANYRIEPDGARDMYTPVIQREPYIGRNQINPGFDPWSDPIRREALARARDSGTAAISGKVRLAVDNDTDVQPGFIMYIPIYAPNQPTESVDQRRAALIGWVFASFRLNDLMASLYGEQAAGLSLTLHDGVIATDATLLFRSGQPDRAAQNSTLKAQEYLVIAGHSWTLSMSASEQFKNHFGRDAAQLIALAGISLSFLLTLLAWLLASGKARAVALAATMTNELRESERRWAFALEGAGDGVWDWNLNSRQALTSQRWDEILGCPPGTAHSIDEWTERMAPDERTNVMAAIDQCLSGPPVRDATCVIEHRIRCDDGTWKWILFRGMVAERDADGTPLRMIGTISDISQRKASEERIRHMAQHDALTDLPNRALFSDRLQLELERAKRHGEQVGLIFLDLDNFKPINDQFGHAVGDRVLQTVAHRLKESIRASDTAGRIGGDEFIILLPSLSHANDAAALAEKIRLALRQPFAVDGLEMRISCSLGVAVFPEDGEDEVTLTKHADQALYRAKENGRDGIELAANRSH